MRLFEATGDEAVDIIADLMAPIAELAQDKELVTLIRNKQKLQAVQLGLKRHKNTLFEVMAICDTGEPVDVYKAHVTALQIPVLLIEITNHPSVANLFTGQEQTVDASSGPATEPTTENKM